MSIQLALYLGVEWNEKLLEKSCHERLKSARKVVDVTLNGNTEWTDKIEGKLTQKNRPHVWYFVLSDCDRVLGSRKVKYNFSIVNPELSHFSVEMKGMKTIYGVLLLILAIGLGKNVYTLIKFCRDEEEIQGPVIWVNLSIVFQILGIGFNYLNLYVYEYDGEGISVLEFFGETFMTISSLAITTLLIIIAGGWTITYTDFPIPELYVPAIFLLTFLHLFMAGFNFLHEREKFSFTRYEGVSGMVIIIMRVIMYAWFLVNLYWTSKRKEISKTGFLHKFGLGSSLYFLSIPLLVLGSGVFAPHMREKIMVAGGNLAQGAAFLFLYMIFTGRGEYYKMNTVLNILPGSRVHAY